MKQYTAPRPGKQSSSPQRKQKGARLLWRSGSFALEDTGAGSLRFLAAAAGRVLEAEIFGVIVGDGVFKQDAVGVEGLVGHHGQAVVAAHIEVEAVGRGGAFHRDGPLAGHDLDAQLLFQVGVDRLLGRLWGKCGDHRPQEIADFQHHGAAVDDPHPLYMVDVGPGREAAGRGHGPVGLGHGEMDHPRLVAGPAAERRLAEALHPAQGKGGPGRGAVEHAHPLALDGLDIAGFDQAGQGPPHGVARAAVHGHQGVLGGDEGLVGVLARFDLIF